MANTDLERIFAALAQRDVRYLVVGGVAVVLHGHPRMTADLDLVVALDGPNVLAAVHALARLGYKPRAPVPAEQFADPVIRQQWIDNKGLTVFSMWSPSQPATEVDLFIKEPFDFDRAYAQALRADLGDLIVTVASIEDIITLKQAVGRPKDVEDVRALRAITNEQGKTRS